jgi:hypothetical protein
VLVFLKMVGATNAAIWLGASVSFVFAVGPAFFSSAMLRLLPVSHAGAAALIVGRHYYALQYFCGTIAVAHLLADWLYSGKPLRRWPTYLVSSLLALALLGGLGLQPRLQRLHLEANGIRSTPQQKARAESAFRGWQVAGHLINFLSVAGLAAYVWQVTSVGIAPRFGGGSKFRGLTNNVS